MSEMRCLTAFSTPRICLRIAALAAAGFSACNRSNDSAMFAACLPGSTGDAQRRFHANHKHAPENRRYFGEERIPRSLRNKRMKIPIMLA